MRGETFRKMAFAFCVLNLAFSFPLKSHERSELSSAFDFRQVARNAIPAVVSIKVKSAANSSFFSSEDEEESQDLFKNDFFQKFFGLPKEKSDDEVAIGQASGFIVSPDGDILTNSHVVRGMSEITVILNDGQEYPAKVIGQDPNTDIALIHIEAKNLPALKLGNSDELEIGQWVAAIGNPMGLQASLTSGVVSAKGRNNLDLSRIEDYIQTDAAVNRGNSGGPLLDLNSNVVGMNTAIVTNMANGGYMGIGFAIPSNLLHSVMQDLKSNGAFVRGYLGVTLQQVDKDLATAFGMDKTDGALVAEVAKNSPAEKAGIKQGDVIVKYNKTTVHHIAALRNAISMMKPGSKLQLAILRNNKTVDIDAEVGSYPDSQQKSAPAKNSRLGLEVENITPEVASKLGLSDTLGVVITKIDPKSPIAWSGIKKGTVILEVNKKKISSVTDFNTALKETEGKFILLLIKQGELTRFVSLKIG